MFEIMPYGHRRVVAYNPFRELEEMSRSFWNDTNLNAFRTDITEKDGVYTLTAELPGFKKEDISVSTALTAAASMSRALTPKPSTHPTPTASSL